MLIPFTNSDPILAARDCCKVHRASQLKEACQLLSMAHHDTGSVVPDLCKPNHAGNRFVKWAQSSVEAYEWLWDFAAELARMHRADHNGKPHGGEYRLASLATVPDLPDVPAPACPLPAAATDLGDVVLSFRNYMAEKLHSWSPGRVNFQYRPSWY